MIALGVVVARPAAAEATPAGATSAPGRERLDHGQQFGVSVMPGTGFRMIVRYNEEQICLDASGTDSKWICTNDVPFFLDFGLSYGVTSGLDLLAEVRLGLARDDARGVGRQFAFAPGIRYWLDRDRRFKFFTTFQLVMDRTRQSQDAVSDRDWGVRNANGLIYDPMPHFGAYFQLGETIGFARWFRLEIDIGLGVQARFP